MNAAQLAADTILIATPLTNQTTVLVSRYARPRSCHRLDGTEKIVYDSRSDAAHGCPKYMTFYRCKACGGMNARGTMPADR